MSDKYEIYEYKGPFGSYKQVLKNGKAVNEFGLLKDVQKLQAENAELKKQSQWISVDDELPEDNTRIITYRVMDDELMNPWGEYDDYWVCDLCYTNKEDLKSNWKEVTHWMPLPTPPEGE